MASPEFSALVIAWQQQHGRHDLPWQGTRDPYRIWASEIMLQQTQVVTVIPYYQRFMVRFPDVTTLAAADEDVVLALWSGLGYYARARNLHHAAQKVAELPGARFPQDIAGLMALPGVGRSTAAAIAAFAYGHNHAILDGNVRRVLTRVFAVPGYPGNALVQKALWSLAESLVPTSQIEAYTQGLMDVGATLCTQRQPRCGDCPLRQRCQAHLTQTVSSYPTPKPVRLIPERTIRMLLIRRGEHLLLEKRPRDGIWGGLWSFPEATLEDDPVVSLKARWGMETLAQRELSPLRHAFTHYRLHIHPLCLSVDRHYAPADGAGLLWLDRADVGQAAVPTPVRKILKLLDQLAMDDAHGIPGLE
ncbi:MAG: A/G-specific adenine glycosylase [Burkholderiales bacterium]|nr:A/G-specific adenine glycosylase [Ferrovum sp.]